MSNHFRFRPFRFRCKKGQMIVILAPHPDDEILGCGQFIVAANAAGISTAVVVLTDGQASHPNSLRWPRKKLSALRRSESRRALARLGGGKNKLRFCGWADGLLASTVAPLQLRSILTQLGASVVLATSPEDHHPDHHATWHLARAATKGSKIPVLPYRVWSRLNDTDLTRKKVPSKRWSIAAFRSQIGNYITDDPNGFTFSPALLQKMTSAPECVRIVDKKWIVVKGV
jgi:LmbE family N-acetylglucosaminyl deacetylase